MEIERTKVAHLEAERKLENLTAANDRLQRDRAGLTVERDAMTVAQDELLARASDLEQLATAGEAASSDALAVLAERSAKLEQTERDLEENRRALHALSERLPAIRTEFVSKETRLREVEQQRATLNDHCGLLTQENDALRTRIEELVVKASKLSRQLSELTDERDELKGLLRELQTSFDHDTAAHAKLKSTHFEAIEAQRLSEANLQEKLSATTTRLAACRTGVFGAGWRAAGDFGELRRPWRLDRLQFAVERSERGRFGSLLCVLGRLGVGQAGARTNIRLRFHAMVTRLHSARTLSRPRNENWRNPSADLMMPNTGSGVCLRKA